MRRIPKYNSEHNLYEQIARYLQQQYPDVIYRFDIAVDLKLTPGQAAKHKRLHPTRGYPDLFIAEPQFGERYCKSLGLYMEIKTESNSPYKKDGTFKKDKHLEEQAEMLENLRARGYRAEFGVGFDKCKQIIDEYLRR
nr:MAG TPA: Nuclease [Caudoviricetes sp.]